MPGMDTRHPITRHALFQDLPDDELERVLPLLRPRCFRRGQVLFHRGDRTGEVHFVMAGAVRIHVGEPPAERVVAYVLPGESVGELSAVDGLPRSATAVAIEDVECYSVDAEAFRQFIERAPVACSRLLRLLSARLRRMDEIAAELLYCEPRVPGEA